MILPVAAPATDLRERSNLAEQVYARIKEELHDFRLVPGDRFSESEIGARLGVSRTPVREALFRLRNEGFLDLESKSGWFVRPIDFARLEQLYDLRVILELASVARLCARTQPVAELDEQFHAALVRSAGNAEIARVHWDVTERIRIVRRLDFTRADRIEATYTEHGKLLRAIIQRKLDQAQLLLRSHIEQSKAEVRKITLATLHEARQRGAR